MVGQVAYGGAEDARRAIDAAEQAWAAPLPAHKRAAILDRVAELIAERREEFARTIAQEAGKPITTALVEVDRAVQTITFSALECRRLAGEMVPMDAHPAGENKLGVVLRVPIGIVAAISPFNFPLNLVCHKVGPAFAAGCPVVLKPAGATPLSALLLAQAFEDAGQPAGWLNVIVGRSSEIGDVMTTTAGAHDHLHRLVVGGLVASARGGAQEGIAGARQLDAADRDGRRRHREGGQAIAANGYAFAGQSCISVQRVYAHESVHDQLLETLVPKVEALKVGDPLDPATQVGPVIDHGNRDRIKEWVGEAVAAGATLLTGGEVDEDGVLHPTLLGNVSLDMKVSCNEVFGPVVTVAKISSLDEAIAQANGTDYGLQAGVFTQDITKAMRAARELDFGGVTLNEAPTFRADQMPYGGVKESGNTREGPKFAVQEMTEPRVVVINL